MSVRTVPRYEVLFLTVSAHHHNTCDIFFGTSYSLEEKTFSTGGIKRKNIAGWEYLEANKGKTDWEVPVSYSDGEKGYQ